MRMWVSIGMTAIIVASVQAQAPPQPSSQPRFDVASIKVNRTNDGVVFDQAQKGRYTIYRYTLAALLRSAYRVQEFQIVGIGSIRSASISRQRMPTRRACLRRRT